MAATAKHFPGLGSAAQSQNTDLRPVVLRSPLTTLRTADGAPHRSAIAAGVKLVMTSWAIYPALDPRLPAGLSSAVIQGELRRRPRAEARVAIFQYIEGFYNPRRRHSTLGYLSPAEYERHHAEHAALALDDPKSANGSLASISARELDGLITRRISTVGVDLVAAGPITPKNALVVPAGSAQAASDAGAGRTVHRRPVRSVVKEQAR